MTSLLTPKEDINFNFAKRISFVPKGLSPILAETKKVDESLSPSTKNKLNKAILQSYENELNTIKWLKYIEDITDVDKFFEELYKEKSKQFEDFVPNTAVNIFPRPMIKLWKTVKGLSFTKELLKDLKIIGQLDKKFIVSITDKKLILLDQHAVHERVRLEALLNEYKDLNNNFKSTPFNFIMNSFEEIEMNILKNHQDLFNNLGLFYNNFKSHIEIYRIPTCIYNKFIRNQKNEDHLNALIKGLIQEHVDAIISARGVISNIPTIIQNIVNSEACRGAIKFGDELSIKECNQYIEQLSQCNLPFQCAHGRPTLIPLIDIQQPLNTEKAMPSLKKLR